MHMHALKDLLQHQQNMVTSRMR